MRKFGIDISEWQGNFDFDAAVNEGVEFVVIKGGGGDSGLYVDRTFERNYREAKKRNLPVGVYWYTKALTVEDAKKEAAYFIEKCLKGKQYELPVYIDVEEKAQLALGKKALTEIVITWLKEVERKGYWVGIYAGVYTLRDNMDDSRLQGYAHWIAQWATKCTYKGKDGVLGMWQFGGETNHFRSTEIAGKNPVDQDYMLVDYPKLIKAAGLNGFKKSVTAEKVEKEEKPKLKSTAEIVKEVLDGKWGVGADRKKRLEAAGYNYSVIQTAVNDKAKPQYETYIVKDGDSLWDIAYKKLGSGIRYLEIKKINGLKSDVIHEGQTLKIPKK